MQIGPFESPRRECADSAALPRISVIINTCDRMEALRFLLEELNHQDYPSFEVVVVLGPTKDRSAEMLVELFPGRIRLVRCAEFNLSASRNAGLADASGEIVAFIDDDAIPCRTWLRQIAGPHADPTVSGVGGMTYMVNPGHGQIQFLGGRVSVLAEQHDVQLERSGYPVFTVPDNLVFPRFHGTNMSYRLDSLIAVRGFDEAYEYLFDDADVGVRLGLGRERLVQLTGATVYHSPTSGRNRGKHPYDLNWYCWLRSLIYFALKNGGPTVGVTRTLRHVIRTVLSFFARVAEAADDGMMTPELHRKARKMLRRATVVGLYRGLMSPRKFPPSIQKTERAFLPYRRPEYGTASANTPAKKQPRERARPLTDDPLRICLLSVGFPPSNTHGVSRSTHTLARGLAESGHEVHVVTSGRRLHVTYDEGIYIHEVNGEENPRYLDLGRRGYRNLAAWLNHSHAVFETVETLSRDHSIQLVDSPLWGLEGFVTAVKGTVPVAVRVVTSMKQIAEVHGRTNPENTLLGDLERLFLSMADMIISNSRATTRAVHEVYDLETEPNAVSLAKYGMVPSADTLVNISSRSTSHRPTVLFVGRLEKRKGILDLFDAIPSVLANHRDARFVIAGSDNSREDGFLENSGADYPTYFRNRYSQFINNVEFTGFVDDSRLEDLYRECDVFTAPSLYESFGLIFLEAMNWAKPVVGCSSGGPLDIVINGETGLLVPPQKPEQLAAAISEILESPARQYEMGQAGRHRLVHEFSHISMARDFEMIYRKFIAQAEN